MRGYYHGGLTLHEERDDRLPYVAFKIDSRYLEHTLTRDNVIRDDNYTKAMNIVGRLAQTRLLEQLVDTLAQWTESARDEPDLERLRARLCHVIITPPTGDLPEAVFERPLVPALTAAGAELLSLARVRKLGKRCWSATVASPVTAALVERGDTVLLYRTDSSLARIAAHLCERAVPRVSSLCTAVAATQFEQARWQPLREAMLAQLRELGHDRPGLELGHLAYAESAVADHVAITQAELGELTELEQVGKLSGGWFGRKRVLVVNADHPSVAHLLVLGEAEPELAAYLLLKLFFLRTELDPVRDNSLASFASEARWLRR
jgi:molecular chaperone HtpG